MTFKNSQPGQSRLSVARRLSPKPPEHSGKASASLPQGCDQGRGPGRLLLTSHLVSFLPL